MAHREYLLPELLEVSTVGNTFDDQRDPEASRAWLPAVGTTPTRFLEDLEPMDDDDLTPPPSPPRIISRDAIDAAFTELQRRERAASAGDEQDEQDGWEDVVIACNVSPEELKRVPDHWWDWLDVTLRYDGTLVAVATLSNQRSSVVSAIYDAVGPQGARHGLACKVNFPLHLGGGRYTQVDVLLFHANVATGTILPLVAFHIVMPHVTNAAMIEQVAECFTLVPSLHSFVCFRFTSVPVNPLAPDELRVPALAIEFHRDTVSDTVYYRGRLLQRVCVAQIRSVGNGVVSPQRLDSFHGVGRHVLVADDVPVTQLTVLQQPSPAFPNALDRTDRAISLDRAMATANRVMRPFHVAMPAPLRPLRLELPTIFYGTIVGWSLDHPLAMAVDDKVNAHVGAVYHGSDGGGVLARWRRGESTMWDMVTFVLRRIFRIDL